MNPCSLAKSLSNSQMFNRHRMFDLSNKKHCESQQWVSLVIIPDCVIDYHQPGQQRFKWLIISSADENVGKQNLFTLGRNINWCSWRIICPSNLFNFKGPYPSSLGT